MSQVFALANNRIIAVPLDCAPLVDLDFEFPERPFRVMVEAPLEGKGNSLLFISEGNDFVVREISTATGVGPEIARIKRDLQGAWAPHNSFIDLSPDGKRVVFTEFNRKLKVFVFATAETITFDLEMGRV